MMPPAERRSVSISVRSDSRRLPAVRFERRADVPPGVVALRLDQEAVVVTFGAAVVFETTDLVGPRGAPIAGVTLREGPLEIAIAGATSDDTTVDGVIEPSGAHLRHLPPGPPTGGTPEVQDAEWQAVDPAGQDTRVAARIKLEVPPAPTSLGTTIRYPRGPDASRWPEGIGDTPTRIEVPETAHGDAREAPQGAPSRRSSAQAGVGASPGPAGAPAARPPRIRVGVRRFALVAMLAATFMLWLHAHRGHQARRSAGSRPPPPVASAAPSGVPPSASREGTAAKAEPAPVTGAGQGLAVSAEHQDEASAWPRRTPQASKPRLAADALARGDLADALKLYDELAAQPSANPAYAALARSLRSRAP